MLQMRRFGTARCSGGATVVSRRSISFNGHAWISSLRYGFPFGPQLGSFVHQYCPVDPSRKDAPPPSEGVSPSTGATSSAAGPTRTVVLDDMAADPEISQFAYDQSPCYAGTGHVDAKAAALIMQRRHDAAMALHRRRPATKTGSDAAAGAEDGSGAASAPAEPFSPTLTFDLLRQIREMYREEMLEAARGSDAPPPLEPTPAGGLPPAARAAHQPHSSSQHRRFHSSASSSVEYVSGSNRATSALDEVFLDDAAIYTRALVYVSGGSRLARDWLAGCAAVCTNHPSLLTIAMQHQGTHEDLEDFARYCEIVGYCDAMDCSLQEESALCERRADVSSHADVDLSGTLVSYNAGAARCGPCDGNGVIIDLPVPLTPPRQADVIKRCLVYDALTALHFMEFDADLLDLSRIRAAASYLGLSLRLVDQLREVVLAEHSLVGEKHATIDAPAAAAEGAARLMPRHN